jgi:ribonucleotide reductase beta subunit family protein with ferritin-like domain
VPETAIIGQVPRFGAFCTHTTKPHHTMIPLDHNSLAMREFHRSKLLVWNPRQIEMARDSADWAALADPERELITRLLTLFDATQSAALRHLPALSLALHRRGAPPDDLLAAAAQLAETARHVDAYDRWLTELSGGPDSPVFMSDPHVRALIDEDLPAWLDALVADDSDAALMRALCMCHLVAEGVLVEAGHAALARALRAHELLPGLCYMLDLVRRDIARHADVAADWLARLVGDVTPAVTMDAIRSFLGPQLHGIAGIFAAVFAPWGQRIPLGIDLDRLAEDARGPLGARLGVISGVRAGEPGTQ